MGLFDKLNNQLEINEIKEKLYEEDELKRIEQRLIFEGYHPDIYLLEEEGEKKKQKPYKKTNNGSGWESYFGPTNSTGRITNPWSRQMSDLEKEEYKKDREMLRNQDKIDREEIRNREKTEYNEKKARERGEKYQDEYDEEFNYIKSKVLRTLRDYAEDIEDIQSRSETKPDGTVDPDKKQKKKDDLANTKQNYKSIMRKLKRQYEELNHDKKYNDVKKSKIYADYFDLDTSVL